jgi:hypothetical protein
MQPPPTQADLITSPDDGLNSYSCMSVEVGVTLIEAYGRGYVAIEYLDGEDHKDFLRRCSGNSQMLREAFCCQNEALKVTTSKRLNLTSTDI